MESSAEKAHDAQMAYDCENAGRLFISSNCSHEIYTCEKLHEYMQCVKPGILHLFKDICKIIHGIESFLFKSAGKFSILPSRFFFFFFGGGVLGFQPSHFSTELHPNHFLILR